MSEEAKPLTPEEYSNWKLGSGATEFHKRIVATIEARDREIAELTEKHRKELDKLIRDYEKECLDAYALGGFDARCEYKEGT